MKYKAIDVGYRLPEHSGTPYTVCFIHSPIGSYVVKGNKDTVFSCVQNLGPCVYFNTYYSKQSGDLKEPRFLLVECLGLDIKLRL